METGSFRLAFRLLINIRKAMTVLAMEKTAKRIDVTLTSGVYRVPAEFEGGFHLVPSPEGTLHLAFWDERRLNTFLGNFGYSPVIIQGKN